MIFRDANGRKKHRISLYSVRYGYANPIKNQVDIETLQSLMVTSR